MKFILIFFMGTSPSVNSGAAGVHVVFDSEKACTSAGNALVESAVKRRNYVLGWGCFPQK